MKARLRTHGGVATLAKAHSLRCGLRLALGTNPSLSLCFATSGLQYWTRASRGAWKTSPAPHVWVDCVPPGHETGFHGLRL